MQDEQLFAGFDAAADGDMTVVTARRTDAGWQIEHVHDDRDTSRVVARVGGMPRPHPAGPPATPPWPEMVERWMTTHQNLTFQLTDEQQQIIRATFERLAAEGKLTL